MSGQKKPTNKGLMGLERTYFEFKKKDQSEAQYVVRKLINKKSKPEIGFIERSPLLSKMETLMPMFKKANEEIQKKEVKEEDKIDGQLVECSSSSDSESEEKNVEEKSQMVDESEEKQSKDGVQINILRYPYPEVQKQVGNEETQKDNSKPLIEEL